MLGEHGRALTTAVFTPVAQRLVAAGIDPNTVTLAGSALTVIASMTLLANGFMVFGSIVVGIVLFADSLDGTVARLSGKVSQFGAVLDATLDRISDGAVFAAIAYLLLTTPLSADKVPVFTGTQTWAGIATLAALILGNAVPYARAKAESVGVNANRGLAERTDRLIIGLSGTLLVGLGLPMIVLAMAMTVVALASALTVAQRLLTVSRELRK